MTRRLVGAEPLAGLLHFQAEEEIPGPSGGVLLEQGVQAAFGQIELLGQLLQGEGLPRWRTM